MAKRSAELDRILAAVGGVMTASLAKEIPQPEAFTYELKWDGYRIVSIKAGPDVRLVSRKGQDYTAPFAAIARDVSRLSARELALDGEVCALDANGTPSFQLLQNRSRGAPLAYFVFDLLWLDGEDLRGRPIEERRARLGQLVGPVGHSGSLVVSTAIDGDPRALLAVACARGLEGIVAKRKGSAYAAGRRPAWLKLKCQERQELAIVGWLPLQGTTETMGSLLLAVKEPDGRLHYVGKVGTGFDDRARAELGRALASLRSEAPTAVGVPGRATLVRHVVPRLVAEVRFSDWTDGGFVRHATFLGLRPDKSPDDCVREAPAGGGASRAPRPRPRRT